MSDCVNQIPVRSLDRDRGVPIVAILNTLSPINARQLFLGDVIYDTWDYLSLARLDVRKPLFGIGLSLLVEAQLISCQRDWLSNRTSANPFRDAL